MSVPYSEDVHTKAPNDDTEQKACDARPHKAANTDVGMRICACISRL